MHLKSDIAVNAARFDPANVSKETEKLNQGLIDLLKQEPAWYDVGASKFREMRLEGKTAFPNPRILEQGRNITIPSREEGRLIACRIFYPNNSNDSEASTKGAIMHLHGGGWVLNSHTMFDSLLEGYSNASDCAVISVGYRLAPEHPFPAGPEDCFDVAEHLVKNAKEEYGGPLRFITGESAGAHLSVLTAFHLLHTQRDFSLPGGLLLHFGVYDLSILPSAYTLSDAPILPLKTLERFIATFAPFHSIQDLKSPSISPLYENLEELRERLPTAMFTCGSEDPLQDDTVLMSARWGIAGGKVVTKFYAGAVHGFIFMGSNEAKLCLKDTLTWIRDRMIN
ncbi:Fc.00g010430.m01.CDS01 [Cosmosporella sp. VM-42]